MYSARDAAAVRRVHEHARLVVRAGFDGLPALTAQVAAVATDEGIDDADVVAKTAVETAHRSLIADQRRWSAITDVDRLHDVFDVLRAHDVVVLEGVPDHWAAAAELERRDDLGNPPVGIAWFTPPDVWHAIDHGMLEINLWHGDSANVADGDTLLADVLAHFDDAGLSAVFDEGRIEVRAHWHRRFVADLDGGGTAPAMPLP